MYGLFYRGQIYERNKWEALVSKKEAQYQKEKSRLEHLASLTEIVYRDRIKVIREKGKETIRYVDRYITPEDDSRCDINPGFVELHDAAAEGRLPAPDSPREFDAGTTPPTLSGVGEVVASNYWTCHELREWILNFQNWAQGVSANDRDRVSGNGGDG